MGDVFHAMDRTNVPIKHDTMKAFLVVLQEVFPMMSEEKLHELETWMRKVRVLEDEIKNSWRVRAVYALYGWKHERKQD